MKKINFYFLLIALGCLLLPSVQTYAKEEQTNEITLIDMGHGIVIPSSFDVKDADGVFATLTNINYADWELQDIDEENYDITLDNGYKVHMGWLYQGKDYSRGWRHVSIYREDGELMFYIGQSLQGVVCSMCDDAGNQFRNRYDRPSGNTVSTDEEGSVVALERATYDVTDNVRKEYQYTEVSDTLRLSTKYDYNKDGGTCTKYSIYKDDNASEEACELYSFTKDDMQDYTLLGDCMVMTSQGWALRYGYNFSDLPSKITKKGISYYAYKLSYVMQDEFLTEEELAVISGKPFEHIVYLTKEQIEILKAENITTDDEVWAKYPEFMEEELEEVFLGDESEYTDPGQEADDAIIRGDIAEKETAEEGTIAAVPDATADTTDSTSGETIEDDVYLTASSNTFMQKITGDVVAINGAEPAYLFTHVESTPVGEQVMLDLMDANYNTICYATAFDLEHTKYKYAYFTLVDVSTSNPYFQIAGSNTAISGNLGYVGDAVTDTENGQEEGAVYVDENWE